MFPRDHLENRGRAAPCVRFFGSKSRREKDMAYKMPMIFHSLSHLSPLMEAPNLHFPWENSKLLSLPGERCPSCRHPSQADSARWMFGSHLENAIQSICWSNYHWDRTWLIQLSITIYVIQSYLINFLISCWSTMKSFLLVMALGSQGAPRSTSPPGWRRSSTNRAAPARSPLGNWQISWKPWDNHLSVRIQCAIYIYI